MTVTNTPVVSKRAIAIARSALAELDEGPIGRFLGTESFGDNVAGHHFEANIPGYHGWEWVAVVACAPGSSYITVNETTLVPGADALQAPDWVPYEERVRPGDLRPGDIMPPRKNDPRLTEKNGHKVLSRQGYKDALKRWRTGEFSPQSDYARLSRHQCRNCAFYIDLSDAIAPNIGVCANEYSADGHIIPANYGCGAHSQTESPTDPSLNSDAKYFDDFGF